MPTTVAPSKGDVPARLAEQDDLIENGVYTNRFFGFSIPIPDKWKAENYDTVHEDRKKYPTLVVPRRASSTPLGTVLFEMFPADSKSPVILVSHLDLKSIPGINVAPDITIPLADALKTRKETPRFENVKGPTPYPLGELTASRIDCDASGGPSQDGMQQTIIVVIVKNQALMFQVVGSPEKGLEALNSIKFHLPSSH